MTAMDTVTRDGTWWCEHVVAGRGARLRTAEDRFVELPVERWLGPATDDEQAVLASVEGPVLDVGCGPGRHVAALLGRGVAALGIDVDDVPLGLARARGLPVLRRSLFEAVPRAGEWATVLLLDGSIGIDGDPLRVLCRAGQVLAPDGRVVVEVAPSRVASRTTSVRVEVDGMAGSWFPWAVLSATDLPDVAAETGFEVVHQTEAEGGRRWFVRLARR